MTIVMNMVTQLSRTITASAFNAKCLALIDEVAWTGAAIVMTKTGRPVSRIVAAAIGHELASVLIVDPEGSS